MMPNSFRVEVADNGFVVRYDDPELMEKNREDGPYVDPERTAVFPDVDSMKAGLDTVIERVVAAAKAEAEGKANDFADAFSVEAAED